MKKTTFNTMFLIRNTKSHKDGKCPVFVRITATGTRTEFVIPLSVDPKDWDSKLGCAHFKSSKADEINDYLELVKSKIRHSKVELEERSLQITAKAIRDRYMGIDPNAKSILTAFKEHNDKCAQMVNDYSPETVIRYITTRSHIANFIQFKYNQQDLPLNEITATFINDFEY